MNAIEIGVYGRKLLNKPIKIQIQFFLSFLFFNFDWNLCVCTFIYVQWWSKHWFRIHSLTRWIPSFVLFIPFKWIQHKYKKIIINIPNWELLKEFRLFITFWNLVKREKEKNKWIQIEYKKVQTRQTKAQNCALLVSRWHRRIK